MLNETGFSIVPASVLELMPKLSDPAVRLAVAIGCFMNQKTRMCWPSIQTLQQTTGLKSRTSLYKAIRELEEVGLLRRFPVKRARGGCHVVYAWEDSGCPRGGHANSQPGVHGVNSGCPPDEQSACPPRGHITSYRTTKGTTAVVSTTEEKKDEEKTLEELTAEVEEWKQHVQQLESFGVNGQSRAEAVQRIETLKSVLEKRLSICVS